MKLSCFPMFAAVVISILSGGTAGAQEPPKVLLEIEAGGLWLARNDVQIPNETGTRFSLQVMRGSRSRRARSPPRIPTSASSRSRT